MWDTHDTDNDEFFQPRTKGERADEQPPPWRSVDIKLNKFRVQALRRKRTNMSKEREALRRRASLLGSCVHIMLHLCWSLA